jgi:hypothetical protein
MIDFYLTTADGAIENGPNEDHHIGSISLEQHQLLGQIWEACKPMGIKISYFEDNETQPESAKILLEQADSKVKCNTQGFNESGWSAGGC